MPGRSRTSILAAFVLLACALPAPAQIPLGSEFRVDSLGFAPPSYFNKWARPAMGAPDGSFIVAWTHTIGLSDVVVRRFDAAGVGQGPEFLATTSTTYNNWAPAVGMDNDGNFVVVWEGGPFGISGQRFDASGARRGGEFQVNSTVGTWEPALAVTPSGDFVVVWAHGSSGYTDVFAQRFDAGGAPAGSEFQVNTITTGNQKYPGVDVDAAGNFVVAWQGPAFNPFSQFAVFGQRYAAGGAPQGSEVRVNSNLTQGSLMNRIRVARSPAGAFVVVWLGSITSPSFQQGILGRRFDASGTPLGVDFRINQTTAPVRFADVDADADGDFVVTWGGDDAGSYAVFARRFGSSGAPVGGQFKVNTNDAVFPAYPSVASDLAGNFVVTWLSRQNGVDGIFAQRYAAGLSAAALAVDGSAGPTSDGNGVFEAGETVAVEPAWLNANFSAETFAGTASNFTGPGAPANPSYTIADGAASYGTVASNATASCAGAADCYTLGVTLPSTRPPLHRDASFHEQISPANLGASKTWTLHIGDSFGDVPRASGFYRFVETLLHHSVTGGCRATQYCPAGSTTREQMAVFVLVAKDGAGNVPPACATPMFSDVPASSPFCPWIEELARRGVVGGCGGGNYCPTAPVSREQTAVFVLLTKEPGVTPPACGTPRFNDVPASSPFCRWIEELARRGVVTGCGGGNYCPTQPVTREQMAVFVSVTFGLMLYGP